MVYAYVLLPVNSVSGLGGLGFSLILSSLLVFVWSPTYVEQVMPL